MKSARDFSIILLSSFLFYYLGNIIIDGWNNYKFWLIPIFNTFYYGIPTALIWIVCYGIFKSKAFLFLGSSITSLFLTYIISLHAKGGNISASIGSFKIYGDGKITLIGMLYKTLLNPLGFLIIISSIMLLKSLIKKIKGT